MSQPAYFLDAVFQTLRGSQAAVSIGDTWDGTKGVQKFGAEFLVQPHLPYVLIDEPGEDRTYFTPVSGLQARPFLATGTLTITAVAASRVQAEQISDLIASTLHDAPLVWTGGKVLVLRLASARFASTPEPGPGSPTMFVRVLDFSFMYQGGI